MELIDLYLALFLSFLKIGLFGFGGGYAMLPLIQHEVVELHGWLSISDFTDIVAISQATPGPIAFNSATYVGYTAVTSMGYSPGYAVLGSAICTLSVSIPSFILMTIVTASFFRLKNNPWMRASLSVLKPAIIGLIASAALMLMNRHNFVDYKSWIIFAAVFIASFKKVDPILLIVLSGIVGFFLYYPF
ncbi:MAG: chromate transporter [Bacteroidota bacterium]|jgi:chromate transporter|nr:chromate transporter [Bacteroidota bacterium]HHU96056.1 chromate transporter [Petrimonas sp.]